MGDEGPREMTRFSIQDMTLGIAIGWGNYGGWMLLVSMAVIYGGMLFAGLPRRPIRPVVQRR